jgi:hypothetical protein
MGFDMFMQIIKNPETCGSRRKFELMETDKSSKLAKVVVKGFQADDSVKFSFDGKKGLSPYLSQPGDHLKACDYVLLARIDDQNYLIFIEMKSESINKNRVSKQFMSSICFMDYCSSILNRFHDSDLLEKCQKRFVVFYKSPPIPKTTTLLRMTTMGHAHDLPDNPMFVAYTKPVRIRQIL